MPSLRERAIARRGGGAGAGSSSAGAAAPKESKGWSACKLLLGAVGALLLLLLGQVAWSAGLYWFHGEEHLQQQPQAGAGAAVPPVHVPPPPPRTEAEKKMRAEERKRGAEEQKRRAAAARKLLAVLEAAGATAHVPLEVRVSEGAGLGIFVGAAVTAGSPLFTLPDTHMLTSKTGEEAALPLLLAREYRNASSELMKLYMATLPSTCPANLAVRSEADLNLTVASLHAWKVKLVRGGLAALDKEPFEPGLSAAERTWLSCMVLSRGMSQTGRGAVMMPFFDLLNHGSSCRQRNTKGQAKIFANRDLAPGDEVTFAYSRSPSKARLLTSFGFSAGAPAASLVAEGLPVRPALDKICARSDLLDLHLSETKDGSFKLSDGMLRKALRCVRLRLYEPEVAAWALESGHIDAPWGGKRKEKFATKATAKSKQLLFEAMQKDHLVAVNTMHMCDNAQEVKQIKDQAKLLASKDTDLSADLRAAIKQETIALLSCASLLQSAKKRIVSRLKKIAPR